MIDATKAIELSDFSQKNLFKDMSPEEARSVRQTLATDPENTAQVVKESLSYIQAGTQPMSGAEKKRIVEVVTKLNPETREWFIAKALGIVAKDTSSELRIAGLERITNDPGYKLRATIFSACGKESV